MKKFLKLYLTFINFLIFSNDSLDESEIFSKPHIEFASYDLPKPTKYPLLYKEYNHQIDDVNVNKFCDKSEVRDTLADEFNKDRIRNEQEYEAYLQQCRDRDKRLLTTLYNLESNFMPVGVFKNISNKNKNSSDWIKSCIKLAKKNNYHFQDREFKRWGPSERCFIFEQFNLYPYDSFRKFLKFFPEYNQRMWEISNRRDYDELFKANLDRYGFKVGDKKLGDFIKNEGLRCQNIIEEKEVLFNSTKDFQQKVVSNLDKECHEKFKPKYISIDELVQNIEIDSQNLNYLGNEPLIKDYIDRISKRNKRIVQSLLDTDQDHTIYSRDYELFENTQRFLRACDTDQEIFQQCNGTITQQQIHLEYLDVTKEISQIHYQSIRSVEMQEFAKAAQSMATVGCNINKNGNVIAGQKILKVCDCSISFAKGVLSSCADNVISIRNAILHPLKTGKEIAKISKELTLCLGEALTWLVSYPELDDFMFNSEWANQEVKKRDADFENIATIVNTVLRDIKNMNQEKKAENLGYITSEVIIAIFSGKAVVKTASIIKPMVVSKILTHKKQLDAFGEVGKEAAKIIASGLQYGARSIKKGTDIVRKHPYVLAGQTSLAEAVNKGIKHSLYYATYVDEVTKSIKKIATNSNYRDFFLKNNLPIIFVPIENFNYALTRGEVFFDRFGSKWIKNPNASGGWMSKFSKIAEDTIGWLGDTKVTQMPAGEIAQKLDNSSKILSKMQSTEKCYNNSIIPRSFIMDIDGQKLWLNPNSTKHINELISSERLLNEFKYTFSIPAQHTSIAQQLILEDLYEALKIAIKEEIPYCKRLTINNWQLEIRHSNIPNGFPTLVHARLLN